MYPRQYLNKPCVQTGALYEYFEWYPTDLTHGSGFILEAYRSGGLKMTCIFRQSAEFSHDVSQLSVKVLYRVEVSKLDDVF